MSEASATGSRLIGVVLAGGASRRLGRDKARVRVGGVESVARVRAALAPHVHETLVIGGEGQHRIADIEPGGGPLQALATACRYRPGMSLLVVACDTPLVPGALLERLASPLSPGCAARVAVVDGRPQPLVAHFGPAAHAPIEAQWAAGRRSLWALLTGLPALALVPVPAGVDPRLARDFDTAADLAALQALA